MGWIKHEAQGAFCEGMFFLSVVIPIFNMQGKISGPQATRDL
jgi:hypothetical protein